MSGLVLKLSPKERVLINGAVIENGDRRSRISVMTPNASILRLKDAIHPEDTKTPIKRACYSIQLLLSGDRDPAESGADILRQLSDLEAAFESTECLKDIQDARASFKEGNFYKSMKTLKRLLRVEENLLK